MMRKAATIAVLFLLMLSFASAQFKSENSANDRVEVTVDRAPGNAIKLKLMHAEEIAGNVTATLYDSTIEAYLDWLHT